MAQVVRRKSRETSTSAKMKTGNRLTNSERAAQLAAAIESDMSDMGLSEREKNDRVSKFSERVDKAIARRARS